MAYRVEISAQAAADAADILTWLISHDAGDRGLQWFRALGDAIASLAQIPLRCPFAAESPQFAFEVRHLFYGRKPHVYRILFTIEGRKVHILHIRHGRRRLLV
ncbi:MAG: type II toxin-antitoxin system RelE/ParE family toxin [Acidobacteriota bacterium]